MIPGLAFPVVDFFVSARVHQTLPKEDLPTTFQYLIGIVLKPKHPRLRHVTPGSGTPGMSLPDMAALSPAANVKYVTGQTVR